jgi:hypothetical protein
MPAEGRRTARLDGLHGANLPQRHLMAVLGSISRTAGTKDFSRLHWSIHGGTASRQSEAIAVKILQRAADVRQTAALHVKVNRCCRRASMAEKLLDVQNITAAFQQVGGKTVPQRVNRGLLGNP